MKSRFFTRLQAGRIRVRWCGAGALVCLWFLAGCNRILGIERAELRSEASGGDGGAPSGGRGVVAPGGRGGGPAAGGVTGDAGGPAGGVAGVGGGAGRVGSVAGGAPAEAGAGGMLSRGGVAGDTAGGRAALAGSAGDGPVGTGGAVSGGGGSSAGEGPGSAGAGGAPPCGGADLMVDTENCGRCGRTCNERACRDGQCEPELLDSASYRGSGIALTSTRILWSSYSLRSVDRVEPLGSAVETLDLASPLDELLVQGDTYFVSVTPGSTGDHIQWGDASGAVPGPALGTEWGNGVKAFVVSGGVLYWAECGGTPRIRYRVLADPSDAGTVAQNFYCPTSMATDGETIWFTNATYGGVRAVETTDRARDGATLLEPKVGSGTYCIIADATHVYFATSNWAANPNDWLPSELYRFDRTGSVTPQRVTDAATQWGPRQIVRDGDDVYWVNFGSPANEYTDGAVHRVGVDDPQRRVEVLAADQPRARAVAVDDRWVYWIVEDASARGQLWRVAK